MDNNQNYQVNNNVPPVAPRGIAVAIILSIVTCGIYAIYWLFKLNDELTILTEGHNATNGGMVILLYLITCHIYAYFWFYKQGEKVDALKASKGDNSGNAKIIYLVLAILGLDVVALALMQDEINKTVA